MNILIFNFSSSGLWHYAVNLTNALGTQGHHVTVVTSVFNSTDLITKQPNTRVIQLAAPHQLPLFFRWLTNPAEQFKLWRIVTKTKPDVIHITDSYAVYVPHAWWLWRYPIVFTQHDPHVRQGDVFRFSSRIIHAVQQWLSRKIVVHGQYIKDVLINRGQPTSKIAVIPHGEYSFFQRWQQPATPIPNAVLFFGRIHAYKGLAVLLSALFRLKEQGHNVHLILAGNGDLTPYQAALDQLPSKTIDNRTIPDANVIAYFQQATAVVLPYIEASQSGVIPIALPAGVPIIASRVGAIPEILHHNVNAILVPPNDSAALADAIEQVVSSEPLRQRLAAAGQETARRELNWNTIAAAYVAVYKQAI